MSNATLKRTATATAAAATCIDYATYDVQAAVRETIALAAAHETRVMSTLDAAFRAACNDLKCSNTARRLNLLYTTLAEGVHLVSIKQAHAAVEKHALEYLGASGVNFDKKLKIFYVANTTALKDWATTADCTTLPDFATWLKEKRAAEKEAKDAEKKAAALAKEAKDAEKEARVAGIAAARKELGIGEPTAEELAQNLLTKLTRKEDEKLVAALRAWIKENC